MKTIFAVDAPVICSDITQRCPFVTAGTLNHLNDHRLSAARADGNLIIIRSRHAIVFFLQMRRFKFSAAGIAVIHRLFLIIISGNLDIQAANAFSCIPERFAWTFCVWRFDGAARAVARVILQLFFELLQKFFIGIFDCFILHVRSDLGYHSISARILSFALPTTWRSR